MKRKMVSATALLMSAVMLAGCGKEATVSEDSAKSQETEEKEEKQLEEISLVDDSFSGCTESDVSYDLVRWLLATNAVEVQGQELDWETIGGTELDSSDSDIAKSYLSSQSVKDNEDAIKKVEELVNEKYDESYERAYNLGSAEAVLAASYGTSQMEFDEYLMYAVPVAKMIQQEFESFDDYGDNYVKGYMYHVGKGEVGDSTGIGLRMLAQQEFVGQADYYDGAYAIDYDMDLSKETYSTFFDDMPEEPDMEALASKTPEFIAGYIAPVELGDNPASGNVEIDGDLYHLPCTITQFMDNGWEIKDAPSELTSNDEEITLKKGTKTITLEATWLTEKYNQVEYGLVEVIDSIGMGSVDVVLPGDIKPGTKIKDAKKVFEEMGIENTSSTDAIDVSISSGSYNNSKISISNVDDKVGSIIMYVTLMTNVDAVENYYKLLEESPDRYNYSHAMSIRAKSYKYREDGKEAVQSDVELSDNLDDFTFQIDGTTMQLPISYQQLVDLGFVFEDGPETMVPAGESYEFSGYYLGNEYSKMNFAVVNHEETEVALGDIPVQYIRATIFGYNQYDEYPFVIAGGVELEIYTIDDLIELYGDLEKDDESFDNGSVQLDYYNYDIDKGWYTFWVQPGGMLSGIEMNVYTNVDSTEEE